MELKIGVVGAAGFIGRDHVKRLTSAVNRAKVVAVSDLDPVKTQAVADSCGAKVYADGMELIADPEVDAVVITSWDPTHAQFVRAAIAEGKPVFCEKPLASDAKDCQLILEDEMKGGKKLVQVGFMRRFDPGYVEMKEILDSGKLGKPLLVHCKSRTPSTPPKQTTSMHATGVAVHEVDVLRWLLDDEFDQTQVIMGRSSCYAPEGLQDPQMMLMTTKSGVVVDVEVAVNAHFGYEICCEVVCENGTVPLPQPSRAAVCLDNQFSYGIMADWSKRFVEAYNNEFQAWVDRCLDGGEFTGADAWDGYVACIVCDRLVDAQGSKLMEPVELPEKPEFYK